MLFLSTYTKKHNQCHISKMFFLYLVYFFEPRLLPSDLQVTKKLHILSRGKKTIFIIKKHRCAFIPKKKFLLIQNFIIYVILYLKVLQKLFHF